MRTTLMRGLVVLAACLLLAPVSSPAQQAGKMARVGVLHAGSSKEPASAQREPLERGLRELGWKPGVDVFIDYRYAEGDARKLPALAADLVRSGVDVIVARAPAAIHAARRQTAKIPIVMSAGGDPVGEGIAQNLSRPGGNVTGVVSLVSALDSKRLELLKETFPQIRRVGVVSNPEIDAHRYEQYKTSLHASARSIQLQIEIFDVRRAEEIAALSEAIGRAHLDALLVRGDPQVLDPSRSELIAIAEKHRLPAVYWWRFFAEAGGLMSYGINFPSMHYRAATYVSRILRGANPAELPIEQPSKFEFVVNLRTAKTLGIEVPKAVLFRADEVIQ